MAYRAIRFFFFLVALFITSVFSFAEDLIHVSAIGNRIEVQSAIKAGASVHVRDQFGNTTLMIAAIDNADLDVLKTLISSGVSVDGRNDIGHTALSLLVAKGYEPLSSPTIQVISRIDKDIKIYGLYESGEESENVVEMIRKYERASKLISYEQIDPDKNPAFLQKYATEDTGLSAGSLIVESGENYKVISGIDLYDVSYSLTGQAQVMGFKAEQRITNALLFVTSGVTPKIYTITGHSEYTFVQLGLLSTIEKENFEVEELNLLATNQIPNDADIITMLSPEFDLTEGEVEVLRTYLENHGSAMIFTDIAAGEMPYLNSLLGSFGVSIEFSIVMEGDTSRLYDANNPLFLAPRLMPHQITDPLIEGGLTVLMPYNMPIVEADSVKRNIEITPLLQTTEKSWIRTELDNPSLFQQAGDRSGPADVAVAIAKRKMEMSEPEGFRLVVAGNASFVGPIPPFGTLKPNVDFFLQSLYWLAGDMGTYIPTLSLFEMPRQFRLPREWKASDQFLYERIKVLLDSGSNLNVRDEAGRNVLMLAVINDLHPAILRELINAGSNLESRDAAGATALMLAVQHADDPDVIRTLVEAQADVNAMIPTNGITVLMSAAAVSANPEIIRVLIDSGADAAAKDELGLTAYDYATNNKAMIGTDVIWELYDLRYED